MMGTRIGRMSTSLHVYPIRCFKECTEIAGLDDAAEFTAVLECMSVLVDWADRATGDFKRFPHYK